MDRTTLQTRLGAAFLICAGILLPATLLAENNSASNAASARFPLALTGVLLAPYCHMEECNSSSIERRDLVRENSIGVLYRLTTKSWSSRHPNGYDVPAKRTGGALSTSYVLCSSIKPAVIFASDEKWLMHRLAPGEPRGVAGYNSADYTLYFAACHGVSIDSALSDQTIRLGKNFGYNLPASAAEQIELNSPQDTFSN